MFILPSWIGHFPVKGAPAYSKRRWQLINCCPPLVLIHNPPFSPRLSYPALTSSPPDESPLPAKWFWRRLGHLHVEIRCFDPFFIHKEQQRSWCVCGRAPKDRVVWVLWCSPNGWWLGLTWSCWNMTATGSSWGQRTVLLYWKRSVMLFISIIYLVPQPMM